MFTLYNQMAFIFYGTKLVGGSTKKSKRKNWSEASVNVYSSWPRIKMFASLDLKSPAGQVIQRQTETITLIACLLVFFWHQLQVLGPQMSQTQWSWFLMALSKTNLNGQETGLLVL